jgi:cell wall-associated NlpC family hydrolase
MMTIHRWRPDIRSLLCGFLAAACLALPAPVLSAEPWETGTDAEPTRFQRFTNRASELALHAMSMIGIRYRRGGNMPESGLDCSGLVRYVFKEAWNKDLPRTSEELSREGQQVDAKDLQPGDLVFYNTLRRSFSHVGIYLGDNKFIHAPSPGGKVRIESMDVGYWKKRFNGARRINDPEQQ